MDHARKELLVARICSGAVRVKVTVRGREHVYLVKRPTRDQVYVAAELYFDVLRESSLEGLYSDEELLAFLLDQGFWDDERDKLFKALPKQIEEFKLKLYKSTFKSNEKKVIRKALDVAKAKFAELSEQRGAYNHASCSGAAAMAKARYLLGCGLHTTDGRPVFNDDAFWEADSGLLDEVMTVYARLRVDEAEYRELARTDPWRTFWNAHKVEGTLFGVSPVDYSDEQRTLVNWSVLFDNVYQHPACPADEVIADDDLLDGWMIEQRRERDARQKNVTGDEVVTNEKIRNSQEVYLVAETVDDARKVVDLNDQFGKATQKRRFDYLKKKGEVNELEMPDTRQRLRTEMTQRMAQSMTGK